MPGPVLGNMNPTGLAGKSAELATLAPGVFAVQETHLTTLGISRFKQELQWNKTGMKMQHGFPAPPKNNSLRTVGGKQTGVAYLSSYPCRAIPHQWSQSDFATGRCLTAAAYVQHRWITMGNVYGYSERSHSVEVQQQTAQLLSGLTSRIVDGAQGLRMISGDWNQERNNLPTADYWEAKGWWEAQRFAQFRWSQPPNSTCKHATIKDFVYLSPEVLPYVKSVEVEWSHFADHAVILVQLSDLSRPPNVPLWRKPAQFGWPAKSAKPIEWPHHASMSNDPDEWYRTIWQNVEEYASKLCEANGMPPLSPHQKGRATTTEVHWSQQQVTPMKPNRRGDIQSRLSMTCIQHNRWTKQIRRLQHMSRCSDVASVTNMEHRASLWYKIRHAPGFPGGFTSWWANLPKQFIATPVLLPCQPPDAEDAMAIFLEFRRVYSALEESMNQAKAIHAADRRQKDPLFKYRDLQRERAEPVQTIVTESQVDIVQVQHLDDMNTILTTDSPLPEGLHSIPIQGVPVSFAINDDHHIQVHPTIAAACGPSLQIQRTVAQVTDILDAFAKEWSPRWQRRQDQTEEQWEPIIGFMKHAVPPKETMFPAITADQLRRTVASKRKHAAVGPDGVSKADVINMPQSALIDMQRLITCLEDGMQWPTQLVTGHVAALAKTPTAQTVGQYRPICVFPILYRAWGSIRARQCLQFLESIAPTTMMGNVPGRSPQKLWFQVQQVVEHSYVYGTEVAGGVADIVKCFNALPRTPLLAIAKHLGFPIQVIRPWMSALHQMQRRFQVQGCVGPALFSDCGFPEGCGMSVVAMAIANITVEIWMYYRHPHVRMWSYVDNWEVVCSSSAEAIQSIEALASFCQLMGLELDTGKTYLWSTSPSGRQMLRSHAQNTKLYARDLGGHMNYSRLPTNRTVQDKIADLQPFWTRLAKSHAPISQKTKAIAVSAWPNIFYGISTVCIGSNHFQRLQSLCTKALNVNQTGANPDLQLSCVCQPPVDPELYSIVNTLMAFRNHHSQDLAQYTLQSLTDGETSSAGPCKSMISALHKLAWHWKDGETCVDQEGLPVHLVTSPKDLLKQRIVNAWQVRVLHTTEALRTTMPGLSQADVQLSMRVFQSLPQEHQGLMRCALNGTQFTRDTMFHAGTADDANCKFCGALDSQLHRHWRCEFFADIRRQFPDLQECQDCPKSMLCHGWLPRAPDLIALQQMLVQIPDTSAKFSCPAFCDPTLDVVDFFMDGACIHPTEKDTRVATWAVVRWTGNLFWPVSCGVVPGLKQTSQRGEIVAAISAVKYCVHVGKPCRLWFDNENVFKVLRAWANGESPPWEHKQDADLWKQLHTQFCHASQFIQMVLKVQAHTEAQEQETVLDAWAVQGNAAADALAAHARSSLSSQFWTCHHSVRTHNQRMIRIGTQMFQMFVQIALRARNTSLPDELAQPRVEEAQPTAVDPGIQTLAAKTTDDFPAKLRTEETPHILAWLGTLLDSSQGVIWVSFHQLLLDYQRYTGRWGPFSTGKCWANRPANKEYSYKEQVQWFSRYLSYLAKEAEVPLRVEQRKPSSLALTFWCGAVQVALPHARRTCADDHYRRHACSLPARQIQRDLAKMPPCVD